MRKLLSELKMSSVNNLKKPFKLVEIPVNNFKDVAIPYHVKLLADHREIFQNEINDNNKMRSQTISIKRVVAQLKGLLYELDTLRAQVENSDLDKFDMKTVSMRKEILQIISEYTELLKQTNIVSTSSKKQIYNSENNENSESELAQLHISTNVSELKLKDKEECLRDVEQLQTDIQDLHSVYGTLHQMVSDQKENVDAIEENVEDAHVNVTAGAQHIITAARLKASVYPVTGAIVGTCIGGPLGLIAGLKVGSLAALSCGVIGFVGGKFLKKHKLQEPTIEVVEPPQEHINADNINKKQE